VDVVVVVVVAVMGALNPQFDSSVCRHSRDRPFKILKLKANIGRVFLLRCSCDQ